MAWNPQYCDVADLASWIHDDSNANNAELTLAIEAASRAVDKATNRQFGLVAAPEARFYTAEYDRHTCRWLIDIDDVQTTVGLIVAVDNDGSGAYSQSITDYALTPANAVPNGRPWTRLEVLPRSAVKPNGLRNGVKVTAQYGWTQVPSAIKFATMIQAARFYDRRENVGGLLTKRAVDDVELGWSASGASQELDPDVLASISAYRKFWVAV
jgi:hypothetical protein